MGLRRNKPPPTVDLNLDPTLGAGLPPLEFKGRRTRPGKRKERERDAQGRRHR